MQERNRLHLISAWASQQRLVLGQQACAAKSNEITAIPLLLEWLIIQGTLVTIGAMGCQTKIAQTILDRGADSVPSSSTPRYSPMPSFPTGRCAIVSARCSMSRVKKTSAECTPVLVRGTWPPPTT